MLVERILTKANPDAASKELAAERSRAEKRITVIEKIIAKLYADNINGIIDDTQLSNVVSSLSLEASNLQALLQRLEMKRRQDNTVEQFQHFLILQKNIPPSKHWIGRHCSPLWNELRLGQRFYHLIQKSSVTAPRISVRACAFFINLSVKSTSNRCAPSRQTTNRPWTRWMSSSSSKMVIR